MGSDSSKEESRGNSPEQSQRRNQYVRQPQQRRQEPSYQYQSPPQTPAERRAPHSYTSEHLQTAVKQTSPNVLERPRAPYNYNSQQLLYPNLNAQVDGYVYVQRSPQPSAPPASEVQASPKAPPRPTQPPVSGSIQEPPELPKAPPRHPPPQTSTVPNIPTRPMSEINTIPNIPTTRPMSEISTVPKMPPTTRPLVSQIGAMPSIPPTLKSPAPLNNSSQNIATTSNPSASVNLKPLVSKISTVPKISPISRAPLPLLNIPDTPPATQSFNTCEAEVKISPLVSPRSAQAISSPASGSSQAANYPANNNNPRPAARNRSNTDAYSCPTCGQRLGLAIYQCLGGHSSCKDCRLAGRPCGTCLSAITDMRNISLEAFMAELTSPCQSPGCTLSFKAYDMERHLKECPFGEIDCPMGTFFEQCSTRCKVGDLASHFDSCHREQRTAEIDKEMYVFNICMETHKLFLIKNGSFTFLVHLKVHERERKISMFVQLLGTKISAGKWTYEFHVYNKRQPLRKYLYVDSCQSIGTPINEIFNESQCATLPLTYAMTFVNESALTYKFYIKKDMNQRGRRPRNNAAR